MKAKLHRIAAVLAFILGALAVFAGGQVLLGRDPGYYVINWLPLYNYTAGILNIFIASVLIWVNSRLAPPIAWGLFSLHALVMIILVAGYRQVVATESLVAMTVRLVGWLIILSLMYIKRRNA